MNRRAKLAAAEKAYKEAVIAANKAYDDVR